MQHLALSDPNRFASVWQKSVPDIAWGTIALFVAYIIGYYFVITSALDGSIPYGVASIFCAYLAYVGFTVLHDAGHGAIVKMGSKLKPLESALGWIASVPLLLVPFPAFKRIHDRHHAFTNDPDRDPDHFTFGSKWYQVVLNCLYIPVQYHVLMYTKLRHIKTIRDTYITTVIYSSIVISLLCTVAYMGYGEELVYLVLIPNALAIFVLAMFFDYIPHHPHKSVDRYHDTRIYPSKILNALLLGQNYHLIHHMYPRLPWYKYSEVYERIVPDLEANNAPIEDLSGGLRPGFMKSPNAHSLQDDGKSVNMLLTVSDVKQLTQDSVELTFELPKGEKLLYKAGQYLMLSKWLSGEQQTRCYSICSSPSKGELKVGVRQQEGGLVSSYINQDLSVGSELIVQGPFGDFVYPSLHSKECDDLILIAGGSGITPILSILETALEEYSSKRVHLIYASRSIESTMFLERIQFLEKTHPKSLRVTYAINDAEFGIGRLNKASLSSVVQTSCIVERAECYICGPEGMKELASSILVEEGLELDRIHVEAFMADYVEPEGELHQVHISLSDGEQHKLRVASNQTILEVAKQEGVSLPHACGTGTCGTCKFKVESGQEPQINDAIPGLSAEDKAAGFTLACQCKPQGSLSLSEVTV